MLNMYPRQQEHDGSALRPVWFDLWDATDDERAMAEKATGLRVPTLAEISEIESSSQLYVEGDALYLSAPIASRSEGGAPIACPIGFVLSPHNLVSVRFGELASFETFAARFAPPHVGPDNSMAAFVGLLEVIVDRLADSLEQIGSHLDDISDAVFHSDQSRRNRADRMLRETLRRVGRMGDHISKIRDTLLALGRMVPFVADGAEAWLPSKLRPRFHTLRSDIASLRDYDEHLSNKVQFLLDANLGLIGIAQSDIFRILTIVSVVGIPPTLVAGIYGMNFKNMPELNWAWGYAYGWALIVISAVLPLIWCRVRGWI